MEKFKTLDEAIVSFASKLASPDAQKIQIKRANMNNEITELRQVVFQLEDPAKTLHKHKVMQPLLAFTFADIIDQLLATSPGLGEKFIPGYDWEIYKRKNGALNYSYGERFHYHGNQIENVITRLKNDINSRQALVSIWNPMIDILPQSWNVPCTILHNILIRNGRLELTVYYRSVDFFGGFQHDMFFSGFFAQLYAQALGVKTGPMTIFVNSLHAYDYNYKRLQSLNKVLLYMTHTFQPSRIVTLYDRYKPQRLDGTYDEIMMDVRTLADKIRKDWDGFEEPKFNTEYFAKWAEFFKTYFIGKHRYIDSDYKLFISEQAKIKTEYREFLP